MIRNLHFDAEKLLFLSLAFMLLSLCLIGSAAIGFDIPVLRQIVFFVFLTFLPGLAILGILKVRGVGVLETIVYSAGLSIAFILLIGLLANLILPYIGIVRPISLLPLTIILVVFNSLLSLWAYKRNKGFSVQLIKLRFSGVFTPQRCLMLALPLLAILGAYLRNQYQNNVLLLVYIVAILGIIVWVSLGRLPQKEYPLAVFMIAVSLILHASLLSDHLWGWDIHSEYYFQNLVYLNGHWDFALNHSYNSALSLVILCPFYSIFLNMDAVWVLKIIYPLIFSLVPLTLFQIFGDQIGRKKAFWAVFFFMAANTFFTEMIQLAKQEVAELFFALIILTLTSLKPTHYRRLSLLIVFSFALIVSHYALGYISLAFIIGCWVIVSLIKGKVGTFWRRFGGNPFTTKPGLVTTGIFLIVSVTYLVMMLGWYGTIAQGSALNEIVNVAEHQQYVLSTEISQPTTTGFGEISQPSTTGFFNPNQRESLILTALGADFFTASAVGKGFRIFQYITELFIIFGFIVVLFRPRYLAVEFLAMTIVAAGLLSACVVIPFFSVFLNASRFYHISLFLLAPVLVIGAEKVTDNGFKLCKYVCTRIARKKIRGTMVYSNINSIYVILLLLAVLGPYFLFNTGFLYEVTGSRPQNSLLYPMVFNSDQFDSPVFNDNEIAAVDWAVNETSEDTLIYGDQLGSLLLHERFSPDRAGTISASGQVPDQACIFLRSWNIHKQELAVYVKRGARISLELIPLGAVSALFAGRHILFSNNDTQIWSPKGD